MVCGIIVSGTGSKGKVIPLSSCSQELHLTALTAGGAVGLHLCLGCILASVHKLSIALCCLTMCISHYKLKQQCA